MFTREGSAAAAGSFLAINSTLQELDLSQNYLCGDEDREGCDTSGLVALAGWLKSNGTLAKLDVTAHWGTDDALAQELKTAALSDRDASSKFELVFTALPPKVGFDWAGMGFSISAET